MAFVVLAALATAILSIGGSEAQIASNHLRAIQAQFLAEAGLEHTFNTLRTTPLANLTTNADALQSVPGIAANTQLGGAGNYNVQYQAAGLWAWRVVSTGTSAIGGSQAIRRAIMSTFFHSDDAILTDGSLTISGSTDVLSTNGQCGNVHANDDLTVNGGINLVISGNATSSGTYEEIGIPSIGGDHDTAPEPQKTIPHIDPADFLAVAQASLDADKLFQMMANGKVFNGNGTTELADLASGGSYCGWCYTSGTPLAQWTLSGNDFCNGTYYFEGNATVTGTRGSDANPWNTTLIATGSLDLAGNSTIGADANYTVHDTLFIAGQDVTINGTPSNGYNGLIAAHEQFSLSGNGNINGFIIGENAPHTPGSPVDANTVSGNITLTYNCGVNAPLQGPLQILSWGL
ncbi:MAG: hypothetical protein FIA90_08370 [candidate division NC10 bacterium]|nr:hypothetical protein [candidate division NC10 bacterium]